jgi:hypothetical protein
MCDYKKGSRIKTGVFFCDRVLVFASHIRYNDRKLFQRERRKTVMKKIVFETGGNLFDERSRHFGRDR